MIYCLQRNSDPSFQLKMIEFMDNVIPTWYENSSKHERNLFEAICNCIGLEFQRFLTNTSSKIGKIHYSFRTEYYNNIALEVEKLQNNKFSQSKNMWIFVVFIFLK